ncbi:MAG: hypothetical protein KJO04_10980 [Bacteroidia bacterium]|nr:hypothetical protein [Bacteroidia bacterium]NNL79182.1 hypothetical protein [Flavobacteriaceae bacterium]
MKKLLLTATLSLLFLACNMNPSKEARIQNLETEMQQATERISELEDRVQTLEDLNEVLKTRVIQLENREN